VVEQIVAAADPGTQRESFGAHSRGQHKSKHGGSQRAEEIVAGRRDEGGGPVLKGTQRDALSKSRKLGRRPDSGWLPAAGTDALLAGQRPCSCSDARALFG